MKWNKIRIKEIRKKAFESLSYVDDNANDKNQKYIWYVRVIPIIFACCLLLCKVFLTSDIISYMITSISIFAGLFFGLLFIVTERYNSKKEQLQSDMNEEVKNYLIRYQNFSRFLIRQISYSIVLSIALICLMAMVYFAPQIPHWNFWGCGDIIRLISKYVLNAFIYYWSVQFVVFIIVILGNTFVMLSDDIN